MYKKDWILFKGMFQIAMFTFGGGYVVIPMIEKTFVDKEKYFTHEELLDMASVAQSSPGAIAINLSALCAYRINRGRGLMIALVAALLPPLLLLSMISFSYDILIQNKMIASALYGMEAAVVALIVDVLFTMLKTIWDRHDFVLYGLLILSFLLSFFTSLHPVYIILASAFLCLLSGKRKGK